MTDQLRNPSTSSSSSVPSAPTRCAGGCGFFGSQQYDNMCSKCYKDTKTKLAQQQLVTVTTTSTSTSEMTTRRVDTSAMTSSSESINSGDASPSSSLTPITPILESISSPVESIISPSTPILSSATTPSIEPTTAAVDVTVPGPSSPSARASSSPATATSAAIAAGSPSSGPLKKKKNRCTFCTKLVGLTYFSCRCDDAAMLCSTHRYPHAHSCKFNHREDKANQITKNNPIVKNDQFEKI